MLKIGEINNCEKCGASYSTHKVPESPDDNWAEKWCKLPVLDEDEKIKTPKGLCQFCNPKSKYYTKIK